MKKIKVIVANNIPVYTPKHPRRSERIQMLRIKLAEELIIKEKNKDILKNTLSKNIKKRSKKIKVKVAKTPKTEKQRKIVKEKKPIKAPRTKKEKKPKENKDKGGYYLMNKFTKLFDEDCKDFMEGKCTNNYCKYIHNYSKLWKEKNNEEFAKRYYSLYQDFQVLLPFERKIFGFSSLDLLLIFLIVLHLIRFVLLNMLISILLFLYLLPYSFFALFVSFQVLIFLPFSFPPFFLLLLIDKRREK